MAFLNLFGRLSSGVFRFGPGNIANGSCLTSRCLNGMLNGNIGVTKSMMAELTDETNMARGFSLIPIAWAAGSTVGFGISFISVVLLLISTPVGPSLAVFCRGHEIVGQISSHILSGGDIHISCHVSLPLCMVS